MIRLYPERVQWLRERQAATITPNYTAMPRGSDPTRTTENLGTISLGTVADREQYAVAQAIETTRSVPTGAERLHLIDLVFWKKTHTLEGAAHECSVSTRTAQQWHADFIHEVARKFGLEETTDDGGTKRPRG